MSETEFKSWAIVQQMGHISYAGWVTTETIAGVSMLRVDVPDVPPVGAFTKYIHPSSLYDLTPVSEETARAAAAAKRAKPFDVWSLEQQMLKSLRAQGKLIEQAPAELSPRWPGEADNDTGDDDAD